MPIQIPLLIPKQQHVRMRRLRITEAKDRCAENPCLETCCRNRICEAQTRMLGNSIIRYLVLL